MNKQFHAWLKVNSRMTRVLITILIISLLCWSGYLPAQAALPADWNSISGIFNQEAADQYNSGRLQILPLDNGFVLFEVCVMQGSESEDATTDFCVSGTFSVKEDGVGAWEEETENGLVSLQFILDGDAVKITQNGTFPVPVEGTYIWLEKTFEVTPHLAEKLLEGLDKTVTGLNHENGEYRLETSELEGDGSFYIKAVSAGTGTLIHTFLIANDLRTVHRYIDSEAAALIYELTDSMMKAVPEAAPGDEEEAISISEAGNETVEEAVPVSADDSANEAGNSGLLPVLIVGALLVIGVVTFVLMKRKRKPSNS